MKYFSNKLMGYEILEYMENDLKGQQIQQMDVMLTKIPVFQSLFLHIYPGELCSEITLQCRN